LAKPNPAICSVSLSILLMALRRNATLLMGVVLGFGGASFAVALSQAGRWYLPNMQGLVIGLAGAGNVGAVLDALLAPRLAAAFGWRSVFGLTLIPAALVLAAYFIFSREAPVAFRKKRLLDYYKRDQLIRSLNFQRTGALSRGAKT
jgi:NNP family nitrate/nitrite transporter-like MFS transporter